MVISRLLQQDASGTNGPQPFTSASALATAGHAVGLGGFGGGGVIDPVPRLVDLRLNVAVSARVLKQPNKKNTPTPTRKKNAAGIAVQLRGVAEAGMEIG